MPKCDFNKVALQMPFHFVYQEQYPVKNMKFNFPLIGNPTKAKHVQKNTPWDVLQKMLLRISQMHWKTPGIKAFHSRVLGLGLLFI